jgi:hypothetical protein
MIMQAIADAQDRFALSVNQPFAGLRTGRGIRRVGNDKGKRERRRRQKIDKPRNVTCGGLEAGAARGILL